MKDLIWLISEISVTDRMKGLSNVDPNLMEWHCSLSSTTVTDEKRSKDSSFYRGPMPYHTESKNEKHTNKTNNNIIIWICN